jgi:hypothetical protein
VKKREITPMRQIRLKTPDKDNKEKIHTKSDRELGNATKLRNTRKTRKCLQERLLNLAKQVLVCIHTHYRNYSPALVIQNGGLN